MISIHYYEKAWHLHHAAPVQHDLPHFTAEKFLEQAGLFLDIYGEKVIGTAFSTQAKERFNAVWNVALQQACAVPISLMLRDFHAANIMHVDSETGHRKAAMIDFQDGGAGPVSYDIASLLEDARLDVSATHRADMFIILCCSGLSTAYTCVGYFGAAVD
jgi:N-acetylmuramate 1-kinase